MRFGNFIRPAALALTAVFATYGQTLVNLGTQTKNVDFSNAPTTKPVKTGAALPATCSVGELFFNTSASAGQNLYSCGNPNTWTALPGNANFLSDPGANGLVQRTAPGMTIAVPAPAGTVVGTTDTQTLTNKSIAASEINSGTLGAARMPSFSGDISTTAGSTAATLATVNSNVGTFGSSTVIPIITADAKGRITSIATASLPSTSSGITQLTGDVLAGPGSGSQAATLATVNSSPGTCGDATHVCVVTTNGKGLVTSQSVAAITGVPGGANTAVQYNNSGSFGGDASNFNYNPSTQTATVTNLTVTGTCAGCAAPGLSNPMTATGDMIIGGTSGTPARLGAGTNGYILTMSGGSPSWQAPSAATGTANAINSGPLSGIPATCTVGAVYLAGDQPAGQQMYQCSATNIWSQTLALGGSGALAVVSGSLDIVTSVVPRLAAANAFTGANTFARIGTGSASATDLAGQIMLTGGSGTYSFAGSYASAPICTATDTTAPNSVKVSATTSTLTVTGTGTDVINYICIARN